ncbi:unnamed protein product [Meloidogyne enterolobii]|uniref:Uncharacterized protein n=2 Tax=Meloidogyne enterolobii TaxID=390850 RepID=A0ACB1AIN1_MELEN
MAARIQSKLYQLLKRRKIDEREKEVNIEEVDIVPTGQREDAEEESDEEEQENIVELAVGSTQKGGLSLWYNSYRYVMTSKNCKNWRCPDRRCTAKVKVLSIEGERARGILIGEHDHMGDAIGFEVEKRRKVFTERIQENPTIKTKKLTDELRKGTAEDTELLVR